MSVITPENFKRNWNIKKCLIESEHKYKRTEGIISFIYCPRTKEFNIGVEERHKELVTAFKTPFADFIRGIYIKEQKKVVLRAFSENNIENFNEQYDTIEALKLQEFKIKFNASSDELRTQFLWQ